MWWDAVADPDPAAAYTRGRTADRDALTELFAQRCGEYQATVTRCGESDQDIRSTVSEAIARREVGVVLAPADFNRRWLPDGIDARVDPRPPWSDLDGVAALTTCALAIALTGTIVLDTGVGQGHRALSLVPDTHVCLVQTSQIVYGVPEAIDALQASGRHRHPLTLISGPSATSDIELVRVEGVHGPRRLEVVLTG
jgi:L-lactate dehydrogenase complex protein LldG